jgi:hypothetical protein
VCTYAYINNKFVQDPDPESDPDPDPDTESDPKLFEKSDPDPDTDPKKIIPDPQHCFPRFFFTKLGFLYLQRGVVKDQWEAAMGGKEGGSA